MIQVTVKNIQGVVTNQASFDTQALADQWVASQTQMKSFGRPERWVDAEDITSMGEDRSLAVASQQVGGPDDERTQYKFAAEYTVEQTDISAQVAQDTLNKDSLSYLAATDWYVVRFAETQKPIPADVVTKRLAARSAIKKV